MLSNDGHTVTLGCAGPSGGGGRPVVEHLAATTEVGEVIVTASKREEKLKDVPASVSELDRQSLQRQNAEKFEDYAASVPGLTVQNTSVIGSLNQLTLRGVSPLAWSATQQSAFMWMMRRSGPRSVSAARPWCPTSTRRTCNGSKC